MGLCVPERNRLWSQMSKPTKEQKQVDLLKMLAEAGKRVFIHNTMSTVLTWAERLFCQEEAKTPIIVC